jgi:hypothetical protein
MVPSAAGATRFPDKITLTPSNPLPTNSVYHVDACGLRPNTLYVVDTAGPPPNYPYTRVEYTSDASGCVRYDAVAAGDVGQYTISVQQPKAWRLVVVDQHVFTVEYFVYVVVGPP